MIFYLKTDKIWYYDRPERRGFPIDEALVLTEYRNLKGQNNRFLEKFKEFVFMEEGIRVW